MIGHAITQSQFSQLAGYFPRRDSLPIRGGICGSFPRKGKTNLRAQMASRARESFNLNLWTWWHVGVSLMQGVSCIMYCIVIYSDGYSGEPFLTLGASQVRGGEVYSNVFRYFQRFYFYFGFRCEMGPHAFNHNATTRRIDLHV